MRKEQQWDVLRNERADTGRGSNRQRDSLLCHNRLVAAEDKSELTKETPNAEAERFVSTNVVNCLTKQFHKLGFHFLWSSVKSNFIWKSV